MLVHIVQVHENMMMGNNKDILLKKKSNTLHTFIINENDIFYMVIGALYCFIQFYCIWIIICVRTFIMSTFFVFFINIHRYFSSFVFFVHFTYTGMGWSTTNEPQHLCFKKKREKKSHLLVFDVYFMYCRHVKT